MVFIKGHKGFGTKESYIKRGKHLSIVLKGRKISKEWRKKLSLSHMGNRQSQSTRDKISKTTKGRPKPWLLGKHHTEEHRRRIGKYHKKEKNINWKGGITPINHKIRTSLEYKLWREAIFKRDNWTCQRCKQNGGELRAHHINNFSNYIDLRLAIDNGITLCSICHKSFHKIYTERNNTLEQLNNFIICKTKI